ncbi:MAG: hypothetical protein ABIK28_10865 [Planctomycetota bacterium]
MRQIQNIPIPKGRTHKNVNYTILKWLMQDHVDKKKLTTIFDIPCGKGVFLDTFIKLFEPEVVVGADVLDQQITGFRYRNVDATRDFDLRDELRDDTSERYLTGYNESGHNESGHNESGQGFGIITSISGISEFDNTSGFLRNCVENLSDHGYLIVTNDNCLTVRDRISFLLFGRFRRFKLLLGEFAPTYKYISLSELEKIFKENRLEILDIIYVALKPVDLLLSPLAVFLFPFKLLYLGLRHRNVPLSYKLKLFPFKTLLCKHYICICRKPGKK